MMTIFIPMSLVQALDFLRDRAALVALSNPCSQVLRAHGNIVGYHCRKHAIEAWRARNGSGELGLVEILFGERFHEKLSWEGKINGTGSDPITGAALWTVTADGSRDLDEASAEKPGDLMPAVRFVMEAIPVAEAPAPRKESFAEWGGGPLGNGGC